MADQIINDQSAKRFHLDFDGCLAFIDYEIDGDKITLIHTEVPPQLGGRGIASKMARAALDYASEKHLQVVPECSFIANYIDKHPEYGKLLQEKRKTE